MILFKAVAHLRGKALILLIICALSSCNSSIDTAYIKDEGWTYESGYSITDFLDFRPQFGYSIKGDTIFYENEPRAIIKKLNKKQHNLQIKSLDGLQVGDYRGELEMFE